MRHRDAHCRDRLLGLLSKLPQDVEGAHRELALVECWDELLRLAAVEGVFGTIGELALAGGHLSDRRRAQLARDLAVERLRARRLRDELSSLMSALSHAGVLAVPLKGPWLAERLYPEPSTRSSSDLDLLVPQAEFSAADEVLRSQGYCGPPAPRPERRSGWAAHHHVSRARAGAAPVDLHFRPTRHFGAGLESWDLFGRLRLNARYPTLDACDELIYLSAHAAAHAFQRLAWLYDLKLFLMRHELDWRIVAARATTARLTCAVALTLEVVDRCLGPPLRETWVRELPSTRSLRFEAARVAVGHARGTGLTARSARACVRLLLCQDPAAALGSLAGHFAAVGTRIRDRLSKDISA